MEKLLSIALASHESGGPRPRLLTRRAVEVLASEGATAAVRRSAEALLERPRRRSQRPPRSTPPLASFPCVNCDSPVHDAPWLFCSPLCIETARTVRYVRAVTADGRIEQADVREAVKIRRASVLGGGYDAEARRLSPAVRDHVLAGNGGRCVACGEPSAEVDHVDPHHAGDINDLANLQPLCSACHRAKTMASHRPLATDEELAAAAALHARISAREPLRECDRPDWAERRRQLGRARRIEFIDLVEAEAQAATGGERIRVDRPPVQRRPPRPRDIPRIGIRVGRRR